MKTQLLHPAEITEYWHLFKDLLKRSLEHGCGESTLSDYLSRALNYQAQIWVFYDETKLEPNKAYNPNAWVEEGVLKGAGLTQFLQYSTHKTLHIVACAGIDWAEWADQYYIVEDFARNNGCTAVESWGRKGWAKLLPKVIPGFEETYVVMRKDITNKLPTGVSIMPV